MDITTMRLDLAKHWFQIHDVNVRCHCTAGVARRTIDRGD
jgi:hypothetical protein